MIPPPWATLAIEAPAVGVAPRVAVGAVADEGEGAAVDGGSVETEGRGAREGGMLCCALRGIWDDCV